MSGIAGRFGVAGGLVSLDYRWSEVIFSKRKNMFWAKRKEERKTKVVCCAAIIYECALDLIFLVLSRRKVS
jgi:hypothetical protein